MSHHFQDGGSLFLVDKMADDVHGDGEDDGGVLLGRNGIQRLKIISVSSEVPFPPNIPLVYLPNNDLSLSR